jgi:hypothetical protein
MLLFALVAFLAFCLLCALVPGVTFLSCDDVVCIFLLLLCFILATCGYSPWSCRCNSSSAPRNQTITTECFIYSVDLSKNSSGCAAHSCFALPCCSAEVIADVRIILFEFELHDSMLHVYKLCRCGSFCACAVGILLH